MTAPRNPDWRAHEAHVQERLGLAAPALAQSEPIRIGWLAALTGPSSAPAPCRSG